MKKYLVAFITCAFVANLLLSGCRRGERENRYQIGTAHVSVTLVDGEAAWPDSVFVRALYPTLFSLEQTNLTSVPLQFDGKKWTADVPLEVLRCWTGCLSVFMPDSTFITGVMCGFDQDRATDLMIRSDKDNRYSWSPLDREEFITINYGDAMFFNNFLDYMTLASPESYKSWQSYIKCEIDTVCRERVAAAFVGTDLGAEIRHLLSEQLKQFYFRGRITYYVKDAKQYCNLDVADPPAEMFKMFLDSLDLYSDAVVDEAIPESFYFYQRFLNRLPINIPEIGDMDIAEWQSEAMPELHKVLSNPTQIFLDKLSAVAYITQIEEYNRLLSPQQIANINAYYKDDLGKIIIKRNQEVAEKLAETRAEIIDLSENESFNLTEFMKRFEGRPVVVDLWNTWCGPCISAMSDFEERKKSYSDSDVVFLYICDVSSPELKWYSYANRESGVHVRLSEEAGYALKREYGFNAIPSYLFFDREHRLVNKYIGFPGVEAFASDIDKARK